MRTRPVSTIRASTALLALLCISNAASLRAQHDNRGRDFWVCFPQNARNEFNAGLNFKLFITGDQVTSGMVYVPGKNPIAFSIQAREIKTINIDTSMEVLGSEEVKQLGVHVEADNPVAVYGLSNRRASTDTYVALPTEALGTSYRAMGYDALIGHDGIHSDDFNSQVTLIATENLTRITINPSANTKGGKRRGTPFTIALDKGQVYQIQGSISGENKSDLTGTLVTSTKPIAFFTGHTCAQVPASTNFCDQLLEEEPPINTWGKQFFVSRLLGKDWYVVRVVANEDDTKIFLNEKYQKTINAGEFFEAHPHNNVMVTSDKPVLVGQYATSSDADSVKVGDPFLMLVAPTEQFLKSYQFVTPVNGSWNHYVNIIAPLGSESSLRLDKHPIPIHGASRIGISAFAILQLEISYGSHSLTCEKPFGLYSYGFGKDGDNYDSYGNCAGQRIAPIERSADTSKPTLEIVTSDGSDDVMLIARDDRINDLGLAKIVVTDSSNQAAPISFPNFDQGAPEVKFAVKAPSVRNCIYVKLQDFAKNSASYSICPTQATGSGTADAGSKYSLTALAIQPQSEHEVYPVQVYPSPAKYGQPVTIEFTNSLPEILSAEVIDEGGNIVRTLLTKSMTGSGKHTLQYESEKYTTGSFFLRFRAFSSEGQETYRQDARFIVIR